MATAWVLTQYTDSEGLHEVGDQVDLPTKSDEEQLSFQTLLNYGIITDQAPKAEAPVQQQG